MAVPNFVQIGPAVSELQKKRQRLSAVSVSRNMRVTVEHGTVARKRCHTFLFLTLLAGRKLSYTEI